MNIRKSFLVLTPGLLLPLAFGNARAQAAPNVDPLHAWIGATTPAALTAWIGERLAAEQKDLDTLMAVKGSRTVENTLRLYDDAQNELALAGNQAYLLYSLADGAEMRDKAQAEVNRVSSASTDLSLNQGVYRALVAVPLPSGSSKDDLATKHYLERSLLEYKLAGVDKDDATRAKIHAMQDKITELSLNFGRNVANDVKWVPATRQELDGLPADYIARHKPGADGSYTLTTDSPDMSPVEDFSTSADLRRHMFVAYHSRAYPANEPVLKNLLETREQLAHTLGYPTYADLATADQMIGSASNLKAFLDQVDAASKEASGREYKQLLTFAQKRQPGLTEISDSDSRYWAELYRKATYDFDAQSVRPYFPYAQVEAGILATASKLFHVTFQRVPDAIVWDKSVTIYDVLDGTKRIGRIYLDMHPREGKDKWFSSGPIVPGIRGRQMPEGMLICNFSGGVSGDPGLMQYDEVVTFFHEFGHLMHHILGGQNEWSQQGGFNVEGDFVEAPSQMLEEMFRSYAVLAPFAKDYKTGATIPEPLVGKMNAAGAYGRGNWVQSQLFYSSYSLQLHDQPAAQLNFDGIWRADHDRFLHTVLVPGEHDFASFTHLTGYASNYYTYVLDKVIAVDFFSQFDPRDLLNGPTAMRYRKAVLEPGATEPAAQLVTDFLGRSQSLDALKAWVNVQFSEGKQPGNQGREVTMRKALLKKLAAGGILLATAGAAGLAQSGGQAPLVTQVPTGKWAIVLHGGAGVIQRSSMTPERDRAYRAGLDEAVRAAAQVLDANGSAVDAVVAALMKLEDNPLFNAGKGAVFTADGKNELDAAIMDGKTLMAGAVAGVTHTKSPISLARAVMEKSPHVMLVGPGADQFAASVGLTQVDPSYFFTEERWQGLVRQLKREGKPIPPRPAGAPPEPAKPIAQLETPDAHKWGTTGIVVRDRQGNIAAGTTTGGVQGKRWGRVGDSPIIGAGTYASNESCGVSATGSGEYFIRLTVARTICSLVQYKGMRLRDAADEVIQKELTALHGDGGIIAMTSDGQIAWSFNSPGMFRARLVEGGQIQLGIYKDEP